MEINIKLGKRMEVIEVAEILSLIEKHAAGLPAIEVLDTQGRKHLLSAVNFPSYEFEKIGPGTKIEVRIQEQITDVRVKK